MQKEVRALLFILGTIFLFAAIGAQDYENVDLSSHYKSGINFDFEDVIDVLRYVNDPKSISVDKRIADFDKNGVINKGDVEGMLEYLFKNTDVSEIENSILKDGKVALAPTSDYCDDLFIRGDVNSDSEVDISDMVYMLENLFVPSSTGAIQGFECWDVGDVNDDGIFDISDVIYGLASIFVFGAPDIFEPNNLGYDEQGIGAGAGIPWVLLDGIDNDNDGLVDEGEAGFVGWERSYDGPAKDYGTSIIQASDGDYVLFGKTSILGTVGGDVDGQAYVTKVSPLGIERWSYDYGDEDNSERAISGFQTSDGGYVLTGVSSGVSSGSDILVIKIDSEGNEEWLRVFDYSLNDLGNSIKQTNDGGYVIVGSIDTGVSNDAYVMKLYANGDEEWFYTFGGLEDDRAESVVLTLDGGYAFAGTTSSFGVDASAVYLVKIDSDGNEEWSSVSDGSLYESGKALVQTSDGGYAVVGSSNSFNPSGYSHFQKYLVKFDDFGVEVWSQTYGDLSINDEGYSIVQTQDQGYTITGYFGDQLSIVKTNDLGDGLWSKTYGLASPYIEIGNGIIEISDGYVVIGERKDSSVIGPLAPLDGSIYSLRTDEFGEVGQSDLIILSSELVSTSGTSTEFNSELFFTGEFVYDVFTSIEVEGLYYESYGPQEMNAPITILESQIGPLPPGYNEVRFNIDHPGTIGEANEDNNEFILGIDVGEVDVEPIFIGYAPGPNSIRIDFRNNGDLETGDFESLITIDGASGSLITTDFVQSIMPGEIVSVFISVSSLSPGSYNIDVEADYNGEIIYDSDVSNNLYSDSIVIS